MRKNVRAWKSELKKHMKPGKVRFVEISHDDWCHIYGIEKTCTCDPVRMIKDKNGNVIVRVFGAGHYDPLELTR